MKTHEYCRSEIKSFSDLNDAQQEWARKEWDDGRDIQYVDCPTYPGELLRLDNFMRAERGSYWHGYYGTSYWDGYFIRLSRCGTMAVVARRSW